MNKEERQAKIEDFDDNFEARKNKPCNNFQGWFTFIVVTEFDNNFPRYQYKLEALKGIREAGEITAAFVRNVVLTWRHAFISSSLYDVTAGKLSLLDRVINDGINWSEVAHSWRVDFEDMKKHQAI
jgi:hypothetical protein